MKAKVAERGQVTIPKALRKKLGIRPGTILEFSEQGGRLLAQKLDSMDALDTVYGTMGEKRSTDEIIAQLRGDG